MCIFTMSDDDIPNLYDEDDVLNSSSDEEGWMEFEDDEDDDNDESTVCLFCSDEFKNVTLAMDHVKTEHDIDFHLLKTKFNMDQYSFIKMINYIRTNNVGSNVIASTEKCKWNDEKYLKPVSYEPWLTFDYDCLATDDGTSDQDRIRELIETVQEKDSLLQQAAIDMENLRININDMIQQKDNQMSEVDHKKNAILQDDGYFQTYAHYGIHHDMLSDEVRTCSYRDAIIKNEETFKDKIVMDLGCGTAILSMFSSNADAKRVISVDQSDIIYHAIEIVHRRKNFTNIEFVKGRLEDINLPVDKVDIIVSEWMGYFLLFEAMLDSVIYARDHHLSPNGLLMPNRCKIFLLGHGDENRHQDLISYWNNVYGFDMSCLQKEVLQETSIEICKPNYVLTEPFIIADLDLMTVDMNYSNFTSEFTLNVVTTGKLTSLIGYFDTFFELPYHVEFSTSPHSTATHWKQAVFYLKDTINVTAGDSIGGTFRCRRDPKDTRS